MKIIYQERQTGKTTDLIKLSAEKQLTIVCTNIREVERISSLATEMNLKIPTMITFRMFYEGKYSHTYLKGFLIDNADELIDWMSYKGVEVHSITLTKQDDSEDQMSSNGIED